MLTLEKFEEASEKVKEVTLETKLIYSDFLSEQTGNKAVSYTHLDVYKRQCTDFPIMRDWSF